MRTKNIEFLSIKFAARIVFWLSREKSDVRQGLENNFGDKALPLVFFFRNPSFATGWFWALFVYGSFTQEPGDLGSG